MTHKNFISLQVISIIFLISLALIPMHTKISGIAWFSFVIFCIVFSVVDKVDDKFIVGSKVLRMQKYLIFIFFLAYVLKWIPQIILDEFNRSSIFNIRMLIVLIATFFLCKNIKVRHNNLWFFRFFSYGLLCAGLATAIITIPFGNNFKFGTNPIPWAASISMLLIVLQVQMLDLKKYGKLFFLFGIISSLIVLFSIFYIGRRGSYFALIWFVFYFLYSLSYFRGGFSVRFFTYSFFICVFFMIASCFLFEDFYLRVLKRIQIGFNEVLLYNENPDKAANTSVGARLYMWQNSLKEISDRWLWGLGIDGTEVVIKKFASDSRSNILLGLNQVHNEYLQAFMSYGIIGLISFLLYPFSLVFVAWKLWYQSRTVSIGLIGIIFLFITSSMTNVNTYHNYFGTVFSLTIAFIFIIARLDELDKENESS